MSTVRRLIAVAAMLLLVPALAACGFSEQTDAVYQASTGTNARNGDVWVLNATIVSARDGSGTFAGTLVNQSQTDTVTLVSVSDATDMPKITIPHNTHVNLAESGTVRLENGDIAAGRFVDLTFEFDNGQTTTLKVPVVAHTGDYADVPVGEPKPGADAEKQAAANAGAEKTTPESGSGQSGSTD